MARKQASSSPGSAKRRGETYRGDVSDAIAAQNKRRRSAKRAERVEATNMTAQMTADDAPAWTDDQLDRAEFAIGGKVVRPATGTLTRGPGRPKSESPKAHVSVRLDPDVLEALKGSGPGWQGRMNDALREAVGLAERRETLTDLLGRLFREQPDQVAMFGYDDPEITIAEAVEGVFLEGPPRRRRSTNMDVRGTSQRLHEIVVELEGETAAKIRAMLEPLTH